MANVACPACRSPFPVPAEAAAAAAVGSVEVRCPKCDQRIVLGDARMAVTTEPARVTISSRADDDDRPARRRRRREQFDDDDAPDISLNADEGYRSSAWLAVVVRNLIWVNVVGSIATIACDVWLFKINREALGAGGPAPLEQSVPAVLASMLVWLFYFPAGIAACVYFLMWFYRVYANLETLGARNLSQTPGWAVGYWFIPILWFYLPLQATQEMWRNSDPDPRRNARDVPWSNLVSVWWVFWTLAFVLSLAGNFGTFGLDAERFELALVASIVAEALTLIAAGLVLAVVARIEARMSARAEAVAAQGSLPEPNPYP
jgi:predicted Zn finger-like uncharacterized protein